jgi:hypothetical protein
MYLTSHNFNFHVSPSVKNANSIYSVMNDSSHKASQFTLLSVLGFTLTTQVLYSAATYSNVTAQSATGSFWPHYVRFPGTVQSCRDMVAVLSNMTVIRLKQIYSII